MKSLKVIFLVHLFFCVAYGFSQHKLQVQQFKIAKDSVSFYAFSKMHSTSSTNFNAFKYTKTLVNQLKRYNLNLTDVDQIRDGKFVFSTKYIGKSFFDDTYSFLNKRIPSVVPKPIDITLLQIPK